MNVPVLILLLICMSTSAFSWQSATLNSAQPSQAATLQVDPDQGRLRLAVGEGKGADQWFRIPVANRLSEGQVLELSFRIRSRRNAAENEDGQGGQSGVLVSFGAEDAENAAAGELRHAQMSSIVLAAGDWEEIQVPFQLKRDFAADEARIQVTRAYFEQAVELDQIRLRIHPAETKLATLSRSGVSYPGQEADAAWRKQAAERIEKLRGAPLEIQVVDAFGQAVEGARIRVELEKHAYLFGSCIKAGRLIDVYRGPAEDELRRRGFLADNQRYRDELQRLFNFVVYENDMKWPQWWNEGRWTDQDSTLRSLDWLERNEYQIKGHTLIWGSWRNTPERLKTLEKDPEALQRAILAHIRDLGMALQGRVQYMDVLNEPMSHKDLIEIVGMDGVAEWFRTAREVLPGTRLVLNEFNLIGNGGSAKRREQFLAFVKELQDREAPLDVIGFQSHFWSPKLTAPEEMWRIMDEVHEATGLPLMVSEFDMNIKDESLQAEYTRDFITAWFAHPASEAFIMWGFWGGAHWMRDDGAMFRKDWSEKANLQSYSTLVLEDWRSVGEGLSSAEGMFRMPALFGRYRIVVEAEGHAPLQRRWEHRSAKGPLWIQVF